MMKKAILLGITVLLLGSAYPPRAADAAQQVQKFKNCTELNRVYKGGVAKSASIKNKGGKTKHQPFVSSALYNANQKMDRDKDGIACEK